MGLLDGKYAFVTGASHGIGRAICGRMAVNGADVAAMDIDTGAGNGTGELVEGAGRRFLPLEGDVSKFAEFENAVRLAQKEFGRIDVLVNNAGITRDNLLIRMSDEDWQAVININLTGVFNGVKAVARFMMKQRSGSIINISSVVGLLGNPGQINYSASKAGVLGVTKSAAREMASRGVRVNAIAPGYIRTRMTEQLAEEARQALMSNIPAARLGEPEDVADVAVFLASDLSGYMTGQVISVDGGMAM